MHPQTRPLQTQKQAQGVVLIVVLVLLVVIAGMSVSVMRNALSTDLITNNNRTQSLATEMAQLALRFCEEDLTKVKDGVPALFTGSNPIKAKSTTERVPGSNNGDFVMAWESRQNWVGTAPVARRLTQNQLRSTVTPFTPAPGFEPQCLAEYSPDADTGEVIVVTARGFSPDFREGTNNRVTNGSVVWLQSRILLSSGG